MLRGALILALTFLALTNPVSAKTINLIVATNGNDQWSGQLEKPSPDGQDGPLATLPAALARARAARTDSAASTDRVRILLRDGTYELNEPIVIRAEDSGKSRQQPLIISSYRNEAP